jgi:hypothetical protein
MKGFCQEPVNILAEPTQELDLLALHPDQICDLVGELLAAKA